MVNKQSYIDQNKIFHRTP